MKNISVLIVDDSEMDCYLLERELLDTDYDIAITKKENGEAAYEFFREHEKTRLEFGEGFPPIVVFLDVNMPLMGGIEFLEKYSKLREENPMLQSSVVMMFTSSKNPKDIAASLEYDFVKGFLVKGEYSAEELEQVISKLLSQS